MKQKQQKVSTRRDASGARYQDYSVLQADETLIADPTRRYFGGAGHVDLPSETHYSTFSNQVGSTELVTFANGSQAGRTRYTAFGEPLSATGGATLPRYGYAGAWGYEGGQASNSPGYVVDVAAEAGLLHVGARYYDPSVGRFLQRDPIGIGGGPNVYQYVGDRPTSLVDPAGEFVPVLLLAAAGGLLFLGGDNAAGPQLSGPPGSASTSGPPIAAGGVDTRDHFIQHNNRKAARDAANVPRGTKPELHTKPSSRGQRWHFHDVRNRHIHHCFGKAHFPRPTTFFPLFLECNQCGGTIGMPSPGGCTCGC